MSAAKLRLEPRIGPADTRAGVAAQAPLRAPRRVDADEVARPPIVSLFATVYLVAGLVCGGLLLSGVASDTSSATDAVLGVVWPYPTLFLCAVAALAGPLLFAGRQAGWYLAGLVVVDALFAASFGFQFLFWSGEPFALWLDQAPSGYARYLAQAAVAGGVLLYLFSAPIREHCQMRPHNAFLAVVLLLALEVALLVLDLPLPAVLR